MGSMFKSVFGDSGSSNSNSNSSWGSNAWTPEMEDLYNQMIGDVMQNGVPDGQEHIGMNETQMGALQGMGAGGTAGQYYQGVLSGEGQAERQAALQASQAAAGTQAANALAGMQQANTQQGVSAGNTGSRLEIAQGVSQGAVQTGLASHYANQNMAFQQNEQNLMSQAANNMQNIYNQQFGAGSIMQQDEKDKAYAEWKKKFGQTSAGKLEFISQFFPAISGVAGGSQSGSSSGSASQGGILNMFK